MQDAVRWRDTREGVKRDDGEDRNLQSIISTHSAYIVADSDFEDIKYLKKEGGTGVIARNLKALMNEYENDKSQYKFLKQYLTISRAEIFFADKAILIEGDTERILFPTIMKKIDLEEDERYQALGREDNYLPLLSQNISIIEVGAYSQIFEKFITFLGVKTLIITDIDSGRIMGKDKDGKDIKGACRVADGMYTSNYAIKHFLKGKDWKEIKTLCTCQRILPCGSGELLIGYQVEEDNYHARSFEDAFIHINRDFISSHKKSFRGLKNKKDFEDASKDAYDLAKNCIEKKTHFALDIIYHSDERLSNWSIPDYIEEGLLWLKED